MDNVSIRKDEICNFLNGIRSNVLLLIFFCKLVFYFV